MCKKNYLLERILSLFEAEKRGRLLDIGCGDGEYAYNLQKMGFDVLAADADAARFRYPQKVRFENCNITRKLPFKNESFDFLVLAEVIEHLKNPYDVVGELNRILKPGGKLVLSTPNILSLKSRLRFLSEGCWEYFREVPLEHSKKNNEVIWNLHLIPWRYHELEYLLYSSGFKVEQISTSRYEWMALFFLIPAVYFQLKFKAYRARKKNCDISRINKILLSKDMLFGEHLIVKAVKQ